MIRPTPGASATTMCAHFTKIALAFCGSVPGLAVSAVSIHTVAGFSTIAHDPSDPASLSQDQVAAVHEDRTGNLWVGTFAGLNHLDAGGGFVHYRHDASDPRSLSHDIVTSVADDRDGFLWVGTLAGLNRIALASLQADRPGTDPTAVDFTIFRHDANDPLSLSHDTVFPILEDRSGILWVGTWGGGLDSWIEVLTHTCAVASSIIGMTRMIR